MDNQNTIPSPDQQTGPIAPASPAQTEASQGPVAPGAPAPVAQTAAVAGEDPEHNYLLAVALSYLFGTFGVDRFYLGYTGTGIAKLLTLGGFGIWHFIDVLLISFGKKAKDSNLPLEGYAKYYKTIRMVAIVVLAINALIVVGVLVVLVISTFTGIQDKAQQTKTQTQYNQQLQMQSTPTYSN